VYRGQAGIDEDVEVVVVIVVVGEHPIVFEVLVVKQLLPWPKAVE
jgi:hypothetical protein